MQPSELILSLTNLVETKRATTAFINGAPGSGKTSLLCLLKKELQRQIRNAVVVGPYSANSVQSFTEELISHLHKTGVLNTDIPEERLPDLIGTFDWLKDNLQTTKRQTILILLDLDYTPLEIDDLRSWFSSIRSLEATWEDGPTKLLFVAASFWNHNLLNSYYQQIRLSFPYTGGQNYFPWDGVGVEQIDGMINRQYPGISHDIPFGKLLHEISGGHPGAAADILQNIPKGQPLSITAILTATKVSAQNGETAQVLVQVWSRLPNKARVVICHLLLLRQIPAVNLRSYFEGMRSAGLLMEKKVAGSTYCVLRSWYVELVARYHLKELAINEEELTHVFIEELVPTLVSINAEAYQVLNEIENLTRNFAIVQLSARRRPNEPLLLNKAQRFDIYHQDQICAHERAIEWQEKCRKAGLSVDLNPQIAYLSIRDLPQLIEELADELRLDQWKSIASAIESIGDIRDAVMHNQLIDDNAYKRLLDLRGAIFEAMRPYTSN